MLDIIEKLFHGSDFLDDGFLEIFDKNINHAEGKNFFGITTCVINDLEKIEKTLSKDFKNFRDIFMEKINDGEQGPRTLSRAILAIYKFDINILTKYNLNDFMGIWRIKASFIKDKFLFTELQEIQSNILNISRITGTKDTCIEKLLDCNVLNTPKLTNDNIIISSEEEYIRNRSTAKYLEFSREKSLLDIVESSIHDMEYLERNLNDKFHRFKKIIMKKMNEENELSSIELTKIIESMRKFNINTLTKFNSNEIIRRWGEKAKLVISKFSYTEIQLIRSCIYNMYHILNKGDSHKDILLIFDIDLLSASSLSNNATANVFLVNSPQMVQNHSPQAHSSRAENEYTETSYEHSLPTSNILPSVNNATANVFLVNSPQMVQNHSPQAHSSRAENEYTETSYEHSLPTSNILPSVNNATANVFLVNSPQMVQNHSPQAHSSRAENEYTETSYEHSLPTSNILPSVNNATANVFLVNSPQMVQNHSPQAHSSRAENEYTETSYEHSLPTSNILPPVNNATANVFLINSPQMAQVHSLQSMAVEDSFDKENNDLMEFNLILEILNLKELGDSFIKSQQEDQAIINFDKALKKIYFLDSKKNMPYNENKRVGVLIGKSIALNNKGVQLMGDSLYSESILSFKESIKICDLIINSYPNSICNNVFLNKSRAMHLIASNILNIKKADYENFIYYMNKSMEICYSISTKNALENQKISEIILSNVQLGQYWQMINNPDIHHLHLRQQHAAWKNINNTNDSQTVALDQNATQLPIRSRAEYQSDDRSPPMLVIDE